MITQRMEHAVEVLAKDAARHPERVGPYAQFLVTASQAANHATPEQRKLMREFAATMPTPEEAITAIERIMGWEETGVPGWQFS